jgi:signal transduction histidine kinase
MEAIKVLIVEDDPAYARLIREMLKGSSRAGFDLTHVGGLSSALKRLKEEVFDIVLLDLNLPDSWGFDTFERLHAVSSMPIVVLTGIADEEIGVKAVQKGAQDYLGKGEVDGNLLSRTIHYALERNRIERERMHAIEELKESRQKLRNLSAHLQSIREEERINIARDIHDELGQALTALKMDLSWLARKYRGHESLFEKTTSMLKIIDMTIQTVRRIITELRPSVLDDLGLTAAIEWQAKEFQNRSRIKCELTINPEEIALDRNRSTAIFRIFQETLTNVARHASATNIHVSMEKKGNRLMLEVRDNGKGITEDRVMDPKSLGLMGMRERALFLGGDLQISGITGKGTTVTVIIPVDRGKQ